MDGCSLGLVCFVPTETAHLVTFPGRLEAEVEFLLLGVGDEGLDQEVVQLPRDQLHLLLLPPPLSDPGRCFPPIPAETQEP